ENFSVKAYKARITKGAVEISA
ncbi:nitrite reductase small subunit, partial [Vibrio splendidus]